MNCYACDRSATKRCPRCGNSFCDEHGAGPAAPSGQVPAAGSGQALCAACLDPVSATPSGTIFRLSLIGLLGASVLALWLLLRPPSLPGESSGIPQPTLAPPTSTLAPSSPRPSGFPGAPPSAAATPAPGPSGAATPTPEPAQPAPIEYVVQEG